jgi:hypothetical protein
MLAELGISALRTLFLLRLLLKSVTTGVLVQMYQERNDEVDDGPEAYELTEHDQDHDRDLDLASGSGDDDATKIGREDEVDWIDRRRVASRYIRCAIRS